MAKPRIALNMTAVTLLGVGFWLSVCLIARTAEPWDAPHYWSVAYPLSLLLSAIVGTGWARHGWVPGIALTVSQMPVMLALAGGGPMTAVGLAILCALAVPAAAASMVGSRVTRRLRRVR